MNFFNFVSIGSTDAVGAPSPASGNGPVAAIHNLYDDVDTKLNIFKGANVLPSAFTNPEEGMSFADNRSDYTGQLNTAINLQKLNRLIVFDGAAVAHPMDSRMQETWGTTTTLNLTSPYVAQGTGTLTPKIRKSNYGRIELTGGVANAVTFDPFPTGNFNINIGQLDWATWGPSAGQTVIYRKAATEASTTAGVYSVAQLIIDNLSGFVRIRGQVISNNAASGGVFLSLNEIWDNGYTGVTT